jgi:mRNA-degrading endonuclease YafQ of YafQ-DinJ toxin-antitoxin module
LIALLQTYISEVASLSEKFAHDFHILERDGVMEDEQLKAIMHELTDYTPRFTPRLKDKDVWVGYVTPDELLRVAIIANDRIEKLTGKEKVE